MKKWRVIVVSDWGEQYACVVEAASLTGAQRCVELDPGWHIEQIMRMTRAEEIAAVRQR